VCACAISSVCVYEHVHMFLCVCVIGCVCWCMCVCGEKSDWIHVRGKRRAKICARACRHGKKNLQLAVCENGVHGICVVLCIIYV